MGNLQSGNPDFMGEKIADDGGVLTLVASATLEPYQTVVDVAVPASTAVTVTLPSVAAARGRKYLIVCRSVASGGSLTISSKGDELSALPNTTLVAGQFAVFENIGGMVWQRADVGQEPAFRAGKYTAVADDASNDSVAIATGLNTIVTAQVMILRGNKCMTDDATITFTGGTLTIADNSTAYVLTTGDVIHWLVTGT